MPIKICAFVIMIFAISSGASYSGTSFNLLQLSPDELIVSSRREIAKIPKQSQMGDISLGYLVGYRFYARTINREELRITDLKTMKTEVLLNFKNKMEAGCHPFSVQYVDDDQIVIEALKFDRTRQISKDTTSHLFRYDRHVGAIQRVPIDIGTAPISIYGKRLYYAGKDGIIYWYDGTNNLSLQIKGTSPTISPDGKKIAYIVSGLIRNSIQIYDVETKKTQSVISFFGAVNPIIRWSGNSRLIAVKTLSDVSLTSLYVVDAATGEIVREFEKSYARNWFFVDESW